MPQIMRRSTPGRHSSLTPWVGTMTVGLALWALLVWCTWQVYFLNRVD
jgi:hypothetical protein